LAEAVHHTLLSPQLYNSRYIHLPVCNRLTTDPITVGR
jgi:hypothetical protein